MSHMRICLPCKVKFQTDEPAGCPRCGSDSFFTMRAGDIGTAIWMDNVGVKFDDLELVTLPSQEQDNS
jgi:DNA-directed RNA polymerase subunit RPC12/RpoP